MSRLVAFCRVIARPVAKKISFVNFHVALDFSRDFQSKIFCRYMPIDARFNEKLNRVAKTKPKAKEDEKSPPQSGGLASATTGGLHPDRCIIGKDRLSLQDMTSDRVGQRLQQRRRFTDPAGQGRPIQIDAIALKDLALAV